MSKRIDETDKNFKTVTTLEETDIAFYDVRKDPFKLYNFYNPKTEQIFRRLPDEIAKNTSEGVYHVSKNTAGGRVRFCTDSRYIAIKADMHIVEVVNRMAASGTAGFDLYEVRGDKYKYIETFLPPIDITDGFESIIYLPDVKERTFEIYFPIYSGVVNLYVGLQEKASLKPAHDYTGKTPILFYGSSVTHGACATRPGLAYPAIVERQLDCDVINLGCSGNCHAEQILLDYMTSLDFYAFVSEYDYNEETAVELEKRHFNMYETFRKAHPDIPIILMSRPSFDIEKPEYVKMRDVVKASYEKAVKEGDKNVYFLDGEFLYDGSDDCTADNIHPNDLGFSRMAEKIVKVLKEVL